MTQQEIQEWLTRSEAGTPVFLVGVAGCGMACLGHLLLDIGFEVSGSDLAWNEFTRALAERNGIIYRGHSEEHLSRSAPTLVVYSSAIPKDNPELLAAQKLGVPTVRRANFLSALLGTQKSLCVSGMHGKTTTTSLFAFVLQELDIESSYAVGGEVPQLSAPAQYFKGGEKESGEAWFVAEIDESDGGLGVFNPLESVILNIDDEHLDYFVSVDRIRAEFASLVERTRGAILFCADDPELSKICSVSDQSVSYGFHPLADYRIELRSFDAAQPSIERFGIWHRGSLLGEFTLQLPGRANVSNSAAVIVWLLRHGFGAKAIAAALAKFKGVRRRQEIVFSDSRFRVIDDYAHHPTEIRETIQAVKRFSPRRLITVFQPHRYTRTECLMEGFAGCFDAADQVWVTEIYAAHEAPIPGVSGQALADALAERGQSPIYEPSLDELRSRLLREVKSGDIVLFLGAGGITVVAHQLAAELGSQASTVVPGFVTGLEEKLGSGSVLRLNEPLAKRTTLRVGGPAEVFLEPASQSDLSSALKLANDFEVPVFVLGRGSNLLIRDSGIRGLVISLAQPAFSEMIVRGDQIVCGAGVRLRVVAAEARRVGLSGLEFLEGIPGTLGGALRMNAGAMGSWMFDVVDRIKFVDYHGEVHERPASELYVEYRGCPLLKNHLAIEAVLKGEPSSTALVKERMNQFSAKRWGSQPAAPSAGCIFKNPATSPAGKLIDELGLKGTKVGGASVSDVHGNFIVNDGSATADDVLKLIDLVKSRARQKKGVELKTEVQIVGG
jgi:UDP-N-acetylmuramate--alanine ligase